MNRTSIRLSSGLLVAALLGAGTVQARPDLVVRDIKLVRGCKIQVTVANIGKTGVPGPAYVLPKAVGVQMWRNGKPWGGLILKGVDPTRKLMKPRSWVRHIWFPRAKNLQLKPGVHTLKVMVDHNKNLAEANERNNVLVRRVKCRKPGGRRLPDLTVTHIKLDKRCRVVVRVKNKGPGPVPKWVWTKHYPKSPAVYLKVNGKNWGGRTIWGFNPSRSLRPKNGTAVYRSSLVVQGAKLIQATIDHTMQVKEVNERNNSKRAKLKCRVKVAPIKVIKLPKGKGYLR